MAGPLARRRGLRVEPAMTSCGQPCAGARPPRLSSRARPGIHFRRTIINMSYWVYLLASRKGGTLYTGVTNNLVRRVFEHKNDVVEGFTQKYGVHTLVWFESTESIEAAIQREKQLKNWKRAWKVALIEKENPNWQDLYGGLL